MHLNFTGMTPIILLDPDTVRENCQSFLARSPSGYMKMKEFRVAMKTVLPNLNIKKMEENTFRMFDTDHDGQISMEEFLILYQILSGGDLNKYLTNL